MFKKTQLATALFLLCNIFSAQQKAIAQASSKSSNNLIQFSGVLVEADSLGPIPYASVIIKNTHRGTISDYFGYFSFVAQKNDTIEFTAIGFGAAQYIIPDSLSSSTYSLIQVLRTDTIYLKTAEVYPWPSKEQFKNAFLNLQLPNGGIANAAKNLDRAALKDQMVGMAVDASLNYKYGNSRYQSKLYYSGQYPPNNILNPVAWAKFIKAWKSGSLKR